MNKLAIGSVIAAVAIGGIWMKSHGHHAATEVSAETGPKLAFDRLWIDHIPKSEQDQIKLFVAITEEPIGIFQQTSRWKGNHEMFMYERNGNEVRAVFPQDKSRESWKLDASECDHETFDYCMEIKGASRAAKKYYSMKGWELDGAHDEAAIEAKVSAIEATLAPATGR